MASPLLPTTTATGTSTLCSEHITGGGTACPPPAAERSLPTSCLPRGRSIRTGPRSAWRTACSDSKGRGAAGPKLLKGRHEVQARGEEGRRAPAHAKPSGGNGEEKSPPTRTASNSLAGRVSGWRQWRWGSKRCIRAAPLALCGQHARCVLGDRGNSDGNRLHCPPHRSSSPASLPRAPRSRVRRASAAGGPSPPRHLILPSLVQGHVARSLCRRLLRTQSACPLNHRLPQSCA